MMKPQPTATAAAGDLAGTGSDGSIVADCIIIGGGPAGLTAATYLRRFHRRVQLFDDGCSRARWIPETHNCPGFPQGVSGERLLQKLREQASTYGVEPIRRRVVQLSGGPDGWEVRDESQTWQARSVILATGVRDRLPDLKSGSIDDAIARGLIRLCAICDGYEATDQNIGVVGPLVYGIRHACFLRSFSSRVSVVPVADAEVTPAALREEWLRRAGELGIQVLPELRDLSCQDDTCEARDVAGGTHRFDTLYAAMGAPARSNLAASAGAAMGKEGAILTDDDLQTSLQGLYAIGDVVTDLNQISVAFGHAAIAATAVHRRLSPALR
jgi:thioredoxin reductase (NADPH)